MGEPPNAVTPNANGAPAINPGDPDMVDMRCLLIIGSSMTQVVEHPDGTRVFTPRHYPG